MIDSLTLKKPIFFQTPKRILILNSKIQAVKTPVAIQRRGSILCPKKCAQSGDTGTQITVSSTFLLSFRSPAFDSR